MEIEDDFIEDSEQTEEEEEKNEKDDIFLTGTKKGLHKEIVLKPPVNIYPIASLSQQLISKMYSLEMFGQSSIGATVSGSVYDLGKHFKSLYSSFPSFIHESNIYLNSQQYTLQKQFDAIKEKIVRSQQRNKKVKEIIRSNERRLPNLNKQSSNEFSELDRINAEMKATAISLKKSIEKLQTLKQQNDQFQAENEAIQQQIDTILSQFKHKCTGEAGQIQKNIVKTEIELRENIKKYKENIMQAQKIVNSYNDPIHSLEVRLSDLNRRIIVCSRPVRIPKISKR
ncbi:hypothetical protein M9Y10_044888 [Tritrichomonas musculus]|uniref:DUF4201 domain-containing protein n=1 Tax=Tritrichomonas musculus TaxID=1915356 RepID=A0ABR2JUW7_9EUKA